MSRTTKVLSINTDEETTAVKHSYASTVTNNNIIDYADSDEEIDVGKGIISVVTDKWEYIAGDVVCGHVLLHSGAISAFESKIRRGPGPVCTHIFVNGLLRCVRKCPMCMYKWDDHDK